MRCCSRSARLPSQPHQPRPDRNTRGRTSGCRSADPPLEEFQSKVPYRHHGDLYPLWIECLPPNENWSTYECQVMPVGPIERRRLDRVDIRQARSRLIALIEGIWEPYSAISHLLSWHHGRDKIIRLPEALGWFLRLALLGAVIRIVG